MDVSEIYRNESFIHVMPQMNHASLCCPCDGAFSLPCAYSDVCSHAERRQGCCRRPPPTPPILLLPLQWFKLDRSGVTHFLNTLVSQRTFTNNRFKKKKKKAMIQFRTITYLMFVSVEVSLLESPQVGYLRNANNK